MAEFRPFFPYDFHDYLLHAQSCTPTSFCDGDENHQKKHRIILFNALSNRFISSDRISC